MANLDRRRAARLISEKNIAGLILLSPESLSYATGAAPSVATMWRRAGAVAVFIPAEADMPETAVVSDLFAPSFRRSGHVTDIRESPIWVESLLQGGPLFRGQANRPNGRTETKPEWVRGSWRSVCLRSHNKSVTDRNVGEIQNEF